MVNTKDFESKEKFMVACLADGTEKTMCEAEWDARQPKQEILSPKEIIDMKEQLDALTIKNEELTNELDTSNIIKDRFTAITEQQQEKILGMETEQSVKERADAYLLSKSIYAKSKLQGLNMPIYHLQSMPVDALQRISVIFDELVHRGYNKYQLGNIIADDMRPKKLGYSYFDKASNSWIEK